jgi:VCBS repeat protein/List-Bact-rpt repeat protein
VFLNSGGRFLTAGFYATGHAPGAVAIADVNGDGKQDLVVANGGAYFFRDPPDNTISVLMGNGDGTFQPHVDYPTGAFPLAVTAADLNGDGKADVVTANANDNTISVFINRGNGTYAPRVDYSTANGPWSLAIGDFNGDGKADVAVAAPGSGVVSVLINNGNGTFRSKVDYATAYGPVSIAAGDFNGDGKLDLATTNCDCPPGGGNVSILLGNGDGTFRPHVEYDTAGSSWALAVGDFNGDKKDDIAVAYGGPTCDRFGNCTSDSGVGVLIGHGDGTFEPVIKYPGGAGSGATGGDFNGDGKLDLAVADGDFAYSSVAYGSSVSIFWGNGDGTLRPNLDFAVGFGSYSLAAGDLNGDHKPDLAVVAENSAGVSVLLNTATVPQFVVSATSPTGGASIQSSPPGINTCGLPGPCRSAFDSGSTVTLTTPGFDSSIWTGDCSSTGTCVLHMTADRSVTVSFPSNSTTFTLNVKKTGNGGGTVESYQQYVNCGAYCSSGFLAGTIMAIGAAPFPGNTFAGWSGGGCSTAPDCYVTMNSDVILTATFNLPAGFHELTVNATGTGSGTITSAPEGINCMVNPLVGDPLGSCAAGFAGGNSITLSFTPDQYSILADWSGGGCSGTGNCVLSLSSDAIVTANIAPAPPPPDFSMSSSAFAPTTISPGQKSTSSITITAQNGFSGSVSLGCSVSPMPQFAPQCSLNPSSITPGTPATLTVSTSGTMQSASMSADSAQINAIQFCLMGLMLVGTGLASGCKRKSGRARVVAGIIVVGVLALEAGCAGGASPANSSGGTPPGSYIVTITGTSASLQHSASVTLTVQ